jgi:hypothetical protein
MPSDSARTGDNVINIAAMRLAVGLLGERDAGRWWQSSFMSPTSAAFLTPVFGPRVLQARYEGVLESARRVHDDHIGVGRVFHPFRLPEVMEQRLFDAVQSAGEELNHIILSPDAAKSALAGLVAESVEPKSGPALLGGTELLVEPSWVASAASLYAAAFAAGVQCFPYFSGSR